MKQEREARTPHDDLLEAAKDVYYRLATLDLGAPANAEETAERDLAILALLRAAIAKAEGRP